MDFAPFTRKDFDMLGGSNTGANSIFKRLTLLRFCISRYLKQKGMDCPGVVAIPAITRGTDARRAGWLGYLNSQNKLTDASLSPLSGELSVSVYVMGKDNFKGEEEGLQVALEFGDGRRLDDEKDLFRRYLLASDYLSLAFLGGVMSLRLRGYPDSTVRLDSADPLVRFLKESSPKYETTKHYITIGRFFTAEEAEALGAATVDTLAETVRRLLILLSNFTSKRV